MSRRYSIIHLTNNVIIVINSQLTAFGFIIEASV